MSGGLSNLYAASAGAVLLVESSGRMFAITVGQGRHLLNQTAFESDFGLKVVLNTVAPDQLKSVDAKTVEENTLHTRREVSRNSSISAFGLDVSRDLLRAVTGRPQDESLGSWLTGSDSLGTRTRTDVPELPELARKLLDSYGSEAYKQHFDFVDFLRPERSPARIQDLEGQLLELLRSRDWTDVHLAAPAPLDWSDMDGFRYSTQPAGEPNDPDPRLTRYLATKDLDTLSLAHLKNDKLLAISAGTTFAQGSWPIMRCIVFEVTFDSQLYVLSGGDWFRIKLEFKDRVYDELARFTSELEGLPDAEPSTTELTYNGQAARALGGLCLDQRLVYDEGPDKMEICDVLTRTGGFIHVKHRGASSTLSHLFEQGLNSAERFLLDADFRSSARQLLAAEDSVFGDMFNETSPDPSSHEVTFAVITRSTRETPLTLPFFSVVSLRSAATRLRAMGFPVSIASIREVEVAR